MDPATIIALVAQVLGILPSLINAGISVTTLIERTFQIVQSPTAATQADLEAAMAELQTLTAQLNADPPAPPPVPTA